MSQLLKTQLNSCPAGLQQEGIYRSSGLKTRVVELRKAYNNRENVSLQDVDPPVVASLLKQYLRYYCF